MKDYRLAFVFYNQCAHVAAYYKAKSDAEYNYETQAHAASWDKFSHYDSLAYIGRFYVKHSV